MLENKLQVLHPVIRMDLERFIEKKLAVMLKSVDMFGTIARLLEATIEENNWNNR